MSDDFTFLEGKVLSGRVYPEFFPFAPDDHVGNIGCGEGPQAIIYRGQYQRMTGIDINAARLRKSHRAMAAQGINSYHTACGNVEQIPLADGVFDKVIAIDIIEHVQNPARMCEEIQRLLKPSGHLLITFPTLHDHYVHLFSWIARVILRRPSKSQPSDGWNPDAHNQAFALGEWINLVESCGFRQVRSRATTLFPPLHLYGVPRFWFKSNLIHAIDRAFCRIPGVKRLGQAMMVDFERV